MFSRRDFGRIALAALPLAARGAAKINSKINGVQIGGQSYSFRDRPMAKAIEACKEVGLGEVELWQGHVEPQTTGRGRPRGTAQVAPGNAARHLRQCSQTMERCRHRTVRLQSELQ